ncbi:MAG: alpha/beta fold hydrolase [Merismopedia sp. SIO2A8]|nr:alpha/beta fold hydrolase [Merismopedia sp. SIO2A8]
MAIAEHFIKVGEFDWFYREAVPSESTDKVPVVCLHGLVSQSYSWRNTLPAIANIGRRAIAPDWLGMGFSERPDRFDFPYTPDAYIDVLAQFLDTVEVETCVLVAQGFLGSVGIQYALRNPDRIERLVICNAPISTSHKLPFKIKQMGWPLIGDMMTQDPLLVDRTLEGGGPYQVDDEDLDVYRRPFLQTSDTGRALFAAIQKLQIPTVTAEIEAGLARWTQPTLVLWGVSDPWLPLDVVEPIVDSLADGTLVRLEQVGHYVQEDWAEKVNDALIPFLRQQIIE